MTLPAVLAAMETVFAPTGDLAAAGLKATTWRLPESLNELPVLLLNPTSGDVTMGSSEMWHHTIEAVAIVERENLPARLPTIYALLEALTARLRANIQLGGVVNVCALTGYRIGPIEYGGTQWVGLTLTLRATEKFSTSYSG